MGTDVVIGTSWSHRLARILVRPLVGSGVTPNDLTTLRLATGLLACGALLPADGAGAWWGGMLWLVLALLDRPPGQLPPSRRHFPPGRHRLAFPPAPLLTFTVLSVPGPCLPGFALW